VLPSAALRCAVSGCAVLCYVVLCCTVLSYVVLCLAVQSCAIQLYVASSLAQHFCDVQRLNSCPLSPPSAPVLQLQKLRVGEGAQSWAVTTCSPDCRNAMRQWEVQRYWNWPFLSGCGPPPVQPGLRRERMLNLLGFPTDFSQARYRQGFGLGKGLRRASHLSFAAPAPPGSTGNRLFWWSRACMCRTANCKPEYTNCVCTTWDTDWLPVYLQQHPHWPIGHDRGWKCNWDQPFGISSVHASRLSV